MELNSEMPNFGSYLKEKINEYCSRDNKSYSMLSRYTAIDRRTLKKIDKDYDLSLLSPSKVVKLVNVTCNENNTDVFNRYKNELINTSDSFEQFFNIFSAESISTSNTEELALTRIATDDLLMKLFSVASTSSGLSTKQAIAIAGQKAEDKLIELVGYNSIEEKNGKFYSTNRNKVYFPIESQPSILRILGENYNPNNRGQQRAIGTHDIESINKEAMKEIHKILANAREQVIKILEHPTSRGNNPFFISIVMESFLQELE